MRDSSPETNTGPYLVCEKFEFGIFHCPCSSLGVSDGRAISDEYRTQTVRFRSYLLPVLLTLLNWSIDAPDGTWFAAIGSFSSDAFKATIGSCDVTLYGVYAGTMDINGMPIIDVQQGTLSYAGWLQSVSTPSLHTFVESSGSTAELLSPAQEVIDQAAAEAAAEAKAKEEAEAAAKAASTPQWKKTGKMVWIPTHGGHCYHSNPYCSGMISPEKVDLGYAKYMGFRNCKKC